MLINEATQAYALKHADDDVRMLALRGTKEAGVDLPLALQQIAGRQTARRKLPSWAAVDGIGYPPHLNMEQCSSEQTARYKAQVVGSLSEKGRFVDLTGGFGVDFYWMSQGFAERVYVEQDPDLCALVEANMATLGLPCSFYRGNASVYLTEMEPASVVYMDPARRNEHGGRTYGIEDCSPNVLELLPMLKEKAHFIVLKLSPMLDWRKAVSDLGCVSEVHIVSVDNECKELVLVLAPRQPELQHLVCVNGGQVCDFIPTLGTKHSHPGNKTFPAVGIFKASEGPLFLYEPNASVMKAGCFAELEERFSVRQVAPNSHLFLSPDEIGDFPGRRFQVQAVSSMNKRELKVALADIPQANVAVRNFPLRAEQLRQKLRLKDGGSVFIFATTMADGAHQLFICRKIG